MKKPYIIFALILLSQWVNAQQVTNVKNSWLGNSNADENTFMPQGIEGMYVHPDGTVYTNVGWEEGGGNFTELKMGNVVHGGNSHGWGAFGGKDAAANSKYVYFLTHMGNEGGGLNWDSDRFPPLGKSWLGVSRRTKADITAAAPFENGKGWPKGSMLVVKEMLDNEKVWTQGLYATETELYISLDYDFEDQKDRVMVYDANTMVFKKEIKVTDPSKLFVDSFGKIWVAINEDATKIERYDVGTGLKLQQEIQMPVGSFVGDFCIDKTDRLLIGDVGKREQVLIYTDINTQPRFTSTFGAEGGVLSGIPGKNGNLKFNQIRGIGTDNNGNIYIGNTQWHTGGQGAIVESYNLKTSALNWSKYCVMFVDAMGIDNATDGKDIYGKVEHFTIDYTKPEGQEAVYSGYTINRYKYPSDPRLHIALASVSVKNINGQKFLGMSSMNGGLSVIYRFNPATDGEVAIPCIIFGEGQESYYPNSILGPWMWRDLNANGQMESGEYTAQPYYPVDGGHGTTIDDNGDIWAAAGERIHHTKFLGLDANKIPIYDGKYEVIALPAPIIKARRIQYNVALDRMYIGGTTVNYPDVTPWRAMGRALHRYDNWGKGNRTSQSELVVPYELSNKTETVSFDAEGDYIFTTIDLGRDPNFAMGQINIFNASTNASLGYIRAPWGYIGWNDVVQCLDVFKRSNGEYVLVQEDDGRNKNVMYRWCPSGNCVETANILSANTDYINFASSVSTKTLAITSNVAWTVTGIPAWLTVNSTSGTGDKIISITPTANTGTANRTATLTISGGTLSKKIVVNQEFRDTEKPAAVTELTASSITPFSFTLNWSSGTDNVGVVGYEVSKNGVAIDTVSGVNYNLERLSPNISYTMTVRSYDASGNWSAPTTKVVTTSAISYPYITARAYANQEKPERAFDGVDWTTWMDWSGKNWIQIQYEAPVVYNKYTIYNQGNANTSQKFDPKDWSLLASNDGINWTTLSTQNNQLWDGPNQPKTYYFINTTAYAYYKLDILAARDINAIMIGEIVFGNGAIVDTQAPTEPNGLTTSNITQESFTLNWNESADNVGGVSYEVFNGSASVGSTSSTNMPFTDLACNTVYIVTVKAKDASGNLSPSSSSILVKTAECGVSGIENNQIQEGFSLYPIPAKNELIITGDLVENAIYEITGIEGKALQTGLVSNSNISISDLKPGMYLIKIITHAGERVQRFVKE
ncbi:MAG TPA: BACON domain-containing carbohydrate-binding protein [Cytophagaceae bacterium]|jgi:chitodextrinase